MDSGGHDASGDHATPHDARADSGHRHDGGHADGGSDAGTDADAADAVADVVADAGLDSPTGDAAGDAPVEGASDALSETSTTDAADGSTPVSCVTNDTPCATPPGGECCGFVCVPGNCCIDADCVTGSAIACQSNVCTACDAVAGNAYVVDPVNGSDGANTTGSNSAGGAASGVCAFKTIGHALGVIGATPPAGTTITVLSDDSQSINGEVFPLTIPANTILRGSSATVKISVTGASGDGGTTGVDGFDLAAPASGLSTLTVDGSGALAGARGVVVGTGSTATTTVDTLTVTGFPAEGILVQGSGVLTVNPGTVSTSNLAGLHITGTASATVSGSSAQQTAFSSDGVGILVDGTGSVSVIGTAGTGGAGTVVANSDGAGGQDSVVFLPAPSGVGAFPSQSLLNGLVVYGGANNGLHVYGGANVKVRNSYVLNNGLSGVRVDANVGCTGVPIACTSNDYSHVDLGNSVGSDWGLNVVQDVSTGTPNKTAGLCFAPNPPAALSTLTLLANGNIFGTDNCSTTAAKLTRATDCTSTTSMDVGLPSATGISIATNKCTN